MLRSPCRGAGVLEASYKSIMHKLPSSYILRRFRLGALLLILLGVQVVAGVFLTVRGLARHSLVRRHCVEIQQIVDLDQEPELWCGIGLLAASPVVYMTQRLLSGRAKCPLCMTPPLIHKNCQRNRNARTFFGSYRIRVALSILTRGRFVCPYCGEPTKCEVRQRAPERQGGGYWPSDSHSLPPDAGKNRK